MEADDALWRQGNTEAARRNWPAAAACFRAHAGQRPDDAASWIALAKAEGLAGHPRREHAATARALACATPAWPLALALARQLQAQHEVRALEALAARLWPRAADAPVDSLVELADLLGQADAHAAALPWLDAALAREPASAPAFYLRGTTQLFLGDFAAARADLAQAIALAPHFAHAHWRLSELRAHDREGAPARIARLQAAREQVAPGSEHDIHFSFALHGELHDASRHDEAWAALERGCSAKRARLRYDAAADQRLFDALPRRCHAGFIDGPGHEGRDEPMPVFIVGLFRAGSTVLERLLSGHSQLADGGESRQFSACLRVAADYRPAGLLDEEMLQRAAGLDFAALGADFMARSAWRARGRAGWTEKLPSNLLNVGLIARALPRARFVHVFRPAMDACFSNLRQLYGDICRYSYDQRELAAYWHGQHALAAHWRSVLGERWLDLAHADLLRDPEAQLRRVLAHLCLDYEPGLLDFAGRGGAVSTASASQVRGGLRAPSPPDWLPYREALRPLAEALGEFVG
jgi:tetratricopeptide (TPR) repeat protein